MLSRHRGAIVAVVVAIFLLPLTALPASAVPWEPASPAPRLEDEEGLISQLWQWLGSLLSVAEDTAGPTETTEAGTCTVMGSSRGCAIDPNGSN